MSEGERRLAAIMFTDMVGYTALGQRNESLSLALLDEQRRIVRPVIARHNGREVKTIGDAFLVEFPSAVDALRCAYDIQRTVREFNLSLDPGKRILLRIGLHVGEVVWSRGDISGDAVNVASRIEPLSEEGGVCLSSNVYDLVRGKVDLTLASIGPRSLKNVSAPMEVYKIVMPWEGERREVIPKPDPRRVAVLPFTNMSPDPNDEYFADGMTEELISTISRMDAFRVIARTSAMHYKDQSKRAVEIAKELQVASLLEGSVRKSGNRVRVSAQLIDGPSEEHLWSNDYEVNLEDVFSIQRDIASKIAQELKIKLLPREEKRIESKESENSLAYVLYLKGRYYWSERTDESLAKAREYFEKVIGLNPSFARAYSGLADISSLIASQTRSGHAGMMQAKSLVQKALELDNGLPEAHASMGFILAHSFEWKESEKHLRKALELNPSYATAHLWYSIFLLWTGRGDEAIVEAMQAEELDPLSLSTSLAIGQTLVCNRQYEEAVKHMEERIKIDPSPPVRFLMSSCYFYNNMYEKAETMSRLVPASSPFFDRAQTVLGMSMARMGRGNETRQILANLVNSGAQSFIIAMLLVELGEKDSAVECLEKAFQITEPSLGWANVFPTFDVLRSNPRFLNLLRQMNLPFEER